MKKLRRRDLPLFCKLDHKFDIDLLVREFHTLGLDQYDKYNDLNAGTSFYSNALTYRGYLRKWFMSDNEIEVSELNGMGLSGQQYRQLALTEFNEDLRSKEPLDRKLALYTESPKMLMKRVDPVSEHYVPEADERNYTKRTELAQGAFGGVLDAFRAKVARSRFAVLMPGFRTATHIDSDTDYTVRIHIPLISSHESVFGVVKNGLTTELHLPADGSAWFVNAGFPHYVENRGTTPRVHIIIALDGQEDLPAMEEMKVRGIWGPEKP